MTLELITCGTTHVRVFGVVNNGCYHLSPSQINREVSKVRQATDRVATETDVSVATTCLRKK